MSLKILYTNFLIFLDLILQVKQIYYLSFYLKCIDDCLTKVYEKNNIILYQQQCNQADYGKIRRNPIIFQK